MHVGRSFFFCGEEPIAEFLLEVAMQIEFGSARVDHDFGGIVVEKEWHMHALGSDLYPLAASTAAFPFPDESAVEIARALGYRRDQGVRSDSKTTKFDHPHGCTANFGDWCVENELTALQQAEALNEQVNSDTDSDDTPSDGAAVLRTEKG